MKNCNQCVYHPRCNECPVDGSGCNDFKDVARFVELPCDIGSDVWWIDEEKNSIECAKNGVAGILINSDGVFVMDQGGCTDRINTQYCYLSEEEAQKALAERNVASAEH